MRTAPGIRRLANIAATALLTCAPWQAIAQPAEPRTASEAAIERLDPATRLSLQSKLLKESQQLLNEITKGFISIEEIGKSAPSEARTLAVAARAAEVKEADHALSVANVAGQIAAGTPVARTTPLYARALESLMTALNPTL